MKLINNSKLALSHGKYVFPIGSIIEVPEKIAEIWMTYKGITQYVSPEDIEAIKEQAVKEALKGAKQVVKKVAKKTAKTVKNAVKKSTKK